MEELDFSGFSLDDFSKKAPDKNTEYKYIKQTLLPSPIFTNIIPKFKVRINKPFRGLSGTSFNDENYQSLIPVEKDSQLDAFSEDDSDEEELLLELTKGKKKEQIGVLSKEPIFQTIKVIVKTKSVLVNGIEFPMGSEIRSSCLVRGIQDGTVEVEDDDKEISPDASIPPTPMTTPPPFASSSSSQSKSNVQSEDSLFVSLKSGFLILIRIYFVPRYFKDSDYKYQTNSPVQNDGDSIFKPFIVQWWNTSNSQPLPSLKTSGYQLLSHRSGLSVISTSASEVFRIYNTVLTNNGIMFKKHVNVECDGLILHSCFAEPFNTNKVEHHNFFLTLVFTQFRRLVLNLFSWSTIEGLSHSFSKSTLPLDNSFGVPIFMLSLNKDGGFLFVNEGELIIVTIHDIMSAEYNFRRYVPPWKDVSFPTSFYRPERNNETFIEGEEDPILISTDNGTVYSVVITKTSVDIRPILRVSDCISIFSLERAKTGYNFIYGSDTGSNKDLLVPEIFSTRFSDHSRIHYSRAKLIKDYKKWAPLLDISVIDSWTSKLVNNQSKQELWGVTGFGRKSRLTHFKHGYPGQRKSNTYDKLRKAEKIQFVYYEERSYLFCSFAFDTTLLEYQPKSEEAFVELEAGGGFLSKGYTLGVTVIKREDEEFLLQVSNDGIMITNLAEYQIIHKLNDRKIIGCDIKGLTLAIMTESELAKVTIEIFQINHLFDKSKSTIEEAAVLSLIGTIEASEPSFVKLIQIEGNQQLLVGSYRGTIEVYDIEGSPTHLNTIELSAFNTYSTKNQFSSELLIPGDIHQMGKRLYVGTLDGYFIELEFHSVQNITCTKFLRLSEIPVKFQSVASNSNFLFIHSKSLWLLNHYESDFPQKVYFDETYEKFVTSMSQIPVQNGPKNDLNVQFAFIRDDGLMVGSISTFREPIIRQVTIEYSKKLQYLPYLSIFITLCRAKTPSKRLRFVDRKSFKEVSHVETNLKQNDENTEIFSTSEFPLTSCIWSIQRNNRISKKVLVGTTLGSDSKELPKGSFKVLDISKIRQKGETTPTIKITELTSFEHHEPITNITQVEADIVFTSGKSIYSTSYNVDEKRLKSVQTLATLPSEIISLCLNKENRLLITTKFDSIYQFDYSQEENLLSPTIKFVTSDPLPNHFVNQAQLNSKIVAGDKLHSSICIMENDLKRPSASRVSYRMTSIPRVFSSNFKSCWVEENDSEAVDSGDSFTPHDMILCIGVNGEITSIRSVPSDDDELIQLSKRINTSNAIQSSIEEEIEKLGRPFVNKLSGTGLLSLNKPSFDYKDNKGVLIDYDLEEISRICDVKVSI